jgi:hypothetical protein
METNSSPGHRSCSTVIQRGREHWVPGSEQKNLAKPGTQTGSQVTDVPVKIRAASGVPNPCGEAANEKALVNRRTSSFALPQERLRANYLK